MGTSKNATAQTHRPPRRSELAIAVNMALCLGGTAMALTVSSTAQSQSVFDAQLELSDLDGSNGFVLNGANAGDRSGSSISGAGDINGDGVADLIMGAPQANPNGSGSGASFVVFGGNGVGIGGAFELSDLDGSNGFVINGIDAGDRFSNSISGAGDINGDGVDDLIIGAFFGRATANGKFKAGESYVVFGGVGTGDGGVLELSDLDGSNGFVINGIDVIDQSGGSVSGAGDVNGDGVADLIIGAPGAEPNGKRQAGESYVVFGGVGVGIGGSLELSDLDGSNGFHINGVVAGDRAGHAVSDAGDVNGDGAADLIIGAYGARSNGNVQAGKSYIVFGGMGVGANGALELSDLNGSNGFVIKGVDFRDFSGVSVSGAGDVNGDGLDDLIIGASGAGPNDKRQAGKSYVVFGGVGGRRAIELSDLDGSDGFVINGIDAGDRFGVSVSSAGDINGDGMADLIIGAYRAHPNGKSDAGESYVVFGDPELGVGGTMELPDLDGSDGFVINGYDQNDFFGRAVSGAGDVNGDGLDDLLIGAPGGGGIDQPNNTYVGEYTYSRVAGESYVVFGRSTPLSPIERCNGLEITVNLNLGQTTTFDDDVVLGTDGADDIRGLGGDDTICGMGGDDIIFGNKGDDWISGGAGVDSLFGGAGDDVIHTGSGATLGTTLFVRGGSGNDEINGGSGADVIFGDSGNDTINGGASGDVLRGGFGDDTLRGNNGDDVVVGNDGNDRVNGGNGVDTLRGGQGDDSLNGGNGNDLMIGGRGVDVCNGGSEMDSASVSCDTVIDVP